MQYEAQKYMPHRPEMAMVDAIVIEEGRRFARTTIREDNLFLRPDGTLDNAALPEIAAQGCAAYDGIERRGDIRPGLLAAIRNVRFHSPVRLHDTIRVEAEEETPLDGWRIATFRVYRESDNMLCAEGQLNLCIL